MTVLVTDKKIIANGNGAATVFSFSPIVIFKSSDLVVTKTDTSGVETTLVEGTGATNYSVSVTTYPGTGSVTYPASGATRLQTGEKITMKRVLPLTQEIDLENQGGYFPEVQETGFDRATMIALQLQEAVDRSLRQPVSDGGTMSELPTAANRASKYLAFDGSGNPVATPGGVLPAIIVTSFSQTVLDDASASAWLTTLGFSTFIKTLIDDADAATALATLGALSSSSIADDSTALAGTSTSLVPSVASVGGWLGRAIAPGGRLSLTTGVSVTTSDVTAAGTIYYTPHDHNLAEVYDGTRWRVYSSSELSLVFEAAQQLSGKNYDVFLFDLSGSLTLGTGPAWTNDTTRADALGRKDGRWTNNASINIRTNGATTAVAANKALYVGTIRMTANAQTEDSVAKRFVWNTYNRKPRAMSVTDPTNSWAYTTATFRQANGAAANQLAFVQGLAEDAVRADVDATVVNTGAAGTTATVGIGVDSTSTNSAQLTSTYTTNSATQSSSHTSARWTGFVGIGYHFIAWLEWSTAVGTTTWFGDNNTPATQQSGIIGTVMG
mgnify:CR=1 FL=1